MEETVIDREKKLEQQFFAISGMHTAVIQELESATKNLNDAKKSHNEKCSTLEITRRSIEVMKKLIGLMSEKSLSKLKNLLTYGLGTIFEDRRYAIDIIIDDRGNVKTAEFILMETLEDGSVRKTTLRDSVGGGVQVVISLILRVYFILVLNLRRFVIIDEALSQVSEAYVDGLFKFLNQTVQELGFNYMFINHDVRFMGYADSVYRVVNGVPKKLQTRGMLNLANEAKK